MFNDDVGYFIGMRTFSDAEKKAIERLHKENCSCVVEKDGCLTSYHGRGVADLYSLLITNPVVFRDAFVADKVVGKGAAALMILGGVRALYTDLISDHAIALLEKSTVRFDYKEHVPDIRNRTNTGNCPVETLCADTETAEECLPLIEGFIKSLKH